LLKSKWVGASFPWYGLPGKTLSVFSRPVDLDWDKFLDDLNRCRKRVLKSATVEEKQ
jgi:hypothetical protein